MCIIWIVIIRGRYFSKKILADITVSWVFQKYFNVATMPESWWADHMKSYCSWDVFLWKNSCGHQGFMSFSKLFKLCTHARITKYKLHEKAVAYETWGAGRAAAPPGLKKSGQTLFSGQAQVAQISWKIKNISLQWKISGQILFFRASAGYSKFWMIKNIHSIQQIQGTLCFSGQAQVAQKSWM